MSGLEIKTTSECLWDAVSLGEIMLRLDPGDMRIKTARNFRVWEGGGEYNVARGLRKAFGFKTAVVTSIVENDIGLLLEDLILQGGVDTRHIKWLPFDGIGREARIGLNFTEKGFGVRGALGVSDRAHSAASLLKKGDIDWDTIFGKEGARWFHCGGIFAALSASTSAVVIEAMQAAKSNGTVISYDLNYRPSLWKTNGGKEKAQEVNREIAEYVDVMLGNEEDFSAALGHEIEAVNDSFQNLKVESYKTMISKVTRDYPNLKAAAATLRDVQTACINDWGALLYYDGSFYEATVRKNLEIYDRVGGGDSFASGLVYGFMTGKDPQLCVEFGAAHGALAMTTPGDTTMASLKEVEKLVGGGGARVER
jgi:2-dehydro-3-deoxygluconokinase